MSSKPNQTFGVSDKVPDRPAAAVLRLSEFTRLGSHSSKKFSSFHVLKFSYSTHQTSYFLLSVTSLLEKRITRRRIITKQSLTIFPSLKYIVLHSLLRVLRHSLEKWSYLLPMRCLSSNVSMGVMVFSALCLATLSPAGVPAGVALHSSSTIPGQSRQYSGNKRKLALVLATCPLWNDPLGTLDTCKHNVPVFS